MLDLKRTFTCETDVFVGHIEHLNCFVRVVFVYPLLLMQSIRCTDKDVGCISQTQIKILRSEIKVG